MPIRVKKQRKDLKTTKRKKTAESGGKGSMWLPVSVYMDTETYENLCAVAETEGKPVARVGRDAVAAYLKARDRHKGGKIPKPPKADGSKTLVTIYPTVEMVQHLEAIKDKEDRSVSYICCGVISAWLKAHYDI